jgi:hypothetical protein
MLQLDNRTPYEAERAVLLDIDGSEIWVIAVKATFNIKKSGPVLADKQEPVCLADEYYGEPGNSSMKNENELVFKKPGTDVVVNGHAYAPKGKPVKRLDVSLRVHNRKKIIRVYGDRIWEDSLLELKISKPRPFIKMPLIYERAFGGIDVSSDNPKKHGAEHRNPIGAGFGMSSSFLKNKPLPNLEDPKDEIGDWKSRPRPVGFGFICKHWEPRRLYAGTCDQEYIENRLPLYPLDFDFRFFLSASHDLVFSPHLRGGEVFELRNLTPDGYIAFSLPKITLGFRTLIEGKWIDHRANLGQVLIEPDVPRIMLTWHTHLPCHRKTFELEKTLIFEKETV